MKAEIERSLDASKHEGVTAQISIGIMDYFLIPFALYLGATNPQIGMLVALPNLLSALSQFFVVDVLRAIGDRRKLLIWSCFLQGMTLAPLPFLAYMDGRGAAWALAALTVSFRVIGAVMGPAWGSLMSDYLPERRRGDYFGRRNQLVGLCGLVTATLFAFVLQVLQPISPAASFAAVFAIGSATRVFSMRYMARMVNLPEHHDGRERFDWRAARSRLRRSNFARFMIYVAGVTFAAQLSGAYLSVHMLRDLGFDYVSYMGVMLASAATSFVSFPIWGRHADVVGNARVLKLNSFLVPIAPLLWTLGEHPLYLVCVEGFAGFVWAGFNLCATNFVYESVPPAKRVQALGWFNLVNGGAIFLGAGLGGLLADRVPELMGHRLHSLFLLSCVLRLGAHFALSRHWEEVRGEIRHCRSRDLFFSVLGMRPLIGDNVETEWEEGAPQPARARR